MSKKAFEKYIAKPVSGAKKKEMLRQQKKASKALEKAEEENARKEKLAKGKQYKRNDPFAPRGTKYDQPKPVPPVQKEKKEAIEKPVDELMPLNKFLAHAGICGRREAAALIKEGYVSVNGVIKDEPGFKVSEKDQIHFKGKKIFIQKNNVYILINKPKDTITTRKDPQNRRTVFDIMGDAIPERVFPVGRLDRNTTGVLLLTNDGELAQKLTHPSFEIKKVYEVKLDKPLTKKDFETILSGIHLEDGFVKADALGYTDTKDKSVIGIEIHSGRNRIVRRLFERLGYQVKNLDRVMFANLTKKNVDRGKWRFLNEKEIRLLKYMNQSFLRETK
ncbi:MAG: pseudouridine synthase [Bacteroidetes bacterium]|nr:pseudouridine synthase [Bacteroidota bacterium]